MKKYYEAYEERYKKIHDMNLSWTTNSHSQIVSDIIKKYKISTNDEILEIGCGEGRDAFYLLNNNYNVFASDISESAIKYAKERDFNYKDKYFVMDILNNDLNNKYKFIYSVACIHMLVEDSDRRGFYKFVYDHLKDDGYSLILTMGDGIKEFETNTDEAWDETIRIHGESGLEVNVATTSCRMINFNTFENEIKENNLMIIEKGLTSVLPEFNQMMYAVVKRNEE